MAALAGAEFIGTADVPDIIPTERIDAVVEGANLPKTIGLLLASSTPGQGFVSHQFARWDDFALPNPIRAGGETDTAPRVSFGTSSSDVDPVLKMSQLVVPIEPTLSQAVGAAQGLPIGALNELLRRQQQYTDVNILALSLGATQIVGTDATNFTMAHFRECGQTFKTLENDGTPVAVLSHAAVRDLQDSASQTMATLTPAQFSNPLMDVGTKQSFLGQVHGIDTWESGNVAVEGAGFSNFMTVVGGNRIMHYVMSLPRRITQSNGDEMQRRASTQWTIMWGDGQTLLRPDDGIVECRGRS